MIPRLWLCADLGHAPAGAVMDRVMAVVAVLPAVVWLRAPADYDLPELTRVARTLTGPTHGQGGKVIVGGDRVDVAREAGTDGVHLPERFYDGADGLCTFTRRGDRADFIVSAAAHDAVGMRRDADVLVLSPFGGVPGKNPPLGVGGFKTLRSLAPTRFVVALGGIERPDDVRLALGAGADGVAVRRALLTSIDPVETCLDLHTALTLACGDANPADLR